MFFFQLMLPETESFRGRKNLMSKVTKIIEKNLNDSYHQIINSNCIPQLVCLNIR